jgi:hypothetical protein
LFAEVDNARLQHLPPGEREKLPGETLATIGSVRDGVKKAYLLLVFYVAPQPLHATADDHQQIVEVVRYTSGQLTDSLKLLCLVQRAFRHFTALGFIMQPLGAAKGDPKHGE